MKLKTLNEHNSERQRDYAQMCGNEPVPNGIACPECGEELLDSNPNVVLTSYPAQKIVHCQKCKYKGYRIA